MDKKTVIERMQALTAQKNNKRSELEKIEKRIGQARKDQIAVVNDIVAIDGAIQDCEFWIAEFDKPASTPVQEQIPVVEHPVGAIAEEAAHDPQ